MVVSVDVEAVLGSLGLSVERDVRPGREATTHYSGMEQIATSFSLLISTAAKHG
jgi:hypothetical protein